MKGRITQGGVETLMAMALILALAQPMSAKPETLPQPGVSESLGEFPAQGPTFGQPTPEEPFDKSPFHLFKPTPWERLRDMNALYNGPYTVDAGRVQVETVVGLFARDHNTAAGADTTTEFLSLASTTVRLGLRHNWDFGVTVPPHIRLRTHDRLTGDRTRQSGMGDVTLRTKYNLWGNDGGSTAFGLVAFSKLPTSQDGIGNRHVEGGVGLPVALELPLGWWLGVTPEFHWFHDVNGDGYHMNFASTTFLWHQIVGDLSGYIESANWVSAERDSPWISTLDVGLTYVFRRRIQFDLGAYIGLTRAANDITPFFGISVRF